MTWVGFLEACFFIVSLIFIVSFETSLQTQSFTPEPKPDGQKQAGKMSDTEPNPSTSMPSLFERRMAFEKISDYNPFVILPHKPTYFLPLTYNTSANNEPFKTLTGENVQPAEIKFQLSLKILMVRNL